MLLHYRLIDGCWRDHKTSVDVLDWEQYLKQRAKDLVVARETGMQLESTEVQVAIARFNLVANWCSSEVGSGSSVAAIVR